LLRLTCTCAVIQVCIDVVTDHRASFIRGVDFWYSGIVDEDVDRAETCGNFRNPVTDSLQSRAGIAAPWPRILAELLTDTTVSPGNSIRRILRDGAQFKPGAIVPERKRRVTRNRRSRSLAA
jgi:hypothetical protein